TRSSPVASRASATHRPRVRSTARSAEARGMDAPNPDPPQGRAIRRFVLRQGRFTPAQQRAFALHWSRYGLDYTGKPRDFAQAFGRTAPLVLEIGFGNGEQLLHSAQAEPERDFLGIEVHRPGVGRLMNALAAAGVGNVRVSAHDAVE